MSRHKKSKTSKTRKTSKSHKSSKTHKTSKTRKTNRNLFNKYITLCLPLLEFYSNKDYDSYFPDPIYSDHAPLSCKINRNLIIITWNVGQFGNIIGYNHKFKMSRVESPYEYYMRLQNIINAILKIRKYIPNAIIFLQELPASNHGGSEAFPENIKYKDYFIKKFNELLNSNKITRLENTGSELALICPNNQQFTFIEENKDVRFTSYSCNKVVDEIYINVHLAYKKDTTQDIEIIIESVLKYKSKPKIIYIVGDFNKNIVKKSIFDIEKFKEKYKMIKNINIYSTTKNVGFSSSNNKIVGVSGNNYTNLDYILQIELNNY